MTLAPSFGQDLLERRSAAPAIASMGLGLALWLLHYFADSTYFLEPWTADLALRPPHQSR